MDKSDSDILAAAKAIRAKKALAKRAVRLERIATLSGAGSALPVDRTFPVIYADPPWKFKAYSDVTGMDRAADNHYPTMDLEAIKALPVPAGADAALLLWATAPMLVEALEVMAAWGFTYKSQIVWTKDRIGTGYWARNMHEILLIGTKGSIPAPPPGARPHSAVQAQVGAHSRKPDVFYDIIEAMFPGLPKLELFARRQREGWHSHGQEVAAMEVAKDVAPVAIKDASAAFPSPTLLAADVAPQAILMATVELFLARNSMSPSAFGILTVNSASLITGIRTGRKLRPVTRGRIMRWMQEYEAAERVEDDVAIALVTKAGFVVLSSDDGLPYLQTNEQISAKTFQRLLSLGRLQPGGDSLFGTRPQTYHPSV